MEDNKSQEYIWYRARGKSNIDRVWT